MDTGDLTIGAAHRNHGIKAHTAQRTLIHRGQIGIAIGMRVNAPDTAQTSGTAAYLQIGKADAVMGSNGNIHDHAVTGDIH